MDELRLAGVVACPDLLIGDLDDITLDNSTPDNRYDNSRIIATNQRQYFSGLTWQRSLPRGLLDVTLGRTYTWFESSQTDSLQRPLFLNRSREGTTSLRGELSWSPTERLDLRLGQDFRASGGEGGALRWEKIRKNAWRVYAGADGRVAVSYRVLAFETSVRSSFLDDSRAFISASSLIGFTGGKAGSPHLLRVHPPDGWTSIST